MKNIQIHMYGQIGHKYIMYIYAQSDRRVPVSISSYILINTLNTNLKSSTAIC